MTEKKLKKYEVLVKRTIFGWVKTEGYSKTDAIEQALNDGDFYWEEDFANPEPYKVILIK